MHSWMKLGPPQVDSGPQSDRWVRVRPRRGTTRSAVAYYRCALPAHCRHRPRQGHGQASCRRRDSQLRRLGSQLHHSLSLQAGTHGDADVSFRPYRQRRPPLHDEPLLIVGQIKYQVVEGAPVKSVCRALDLWYAYLEWHKPHRAGEVFAFKLNALEENRTEWF